METLIDPIFVISHKFIMGYESYLKYYVNNIINMYNKSLIIIVDNNSENKNLIFDELPKTENIVILDNNNESKFELGAYQVGIDYILKSGLELNYEYVVFTQDNYILKKKYNFNELKSKNVTACPITSWHNDWAKMDVWLPVLTKLNLLNRLDETKLCWCCSFILSTKKLPKLMSYLEQIIVKTRHQSEGAERYMGRIILELNDGTFSDIDGDIDSLNYYCHTVNPYDDIDTFFCKKSQQKNEKTESKL